ncbi:hypothetical protein BDQ17DRAFT_1368840 [Cyathus striatus]|nr:hypothetical protein BDQ17DRAFT_1368840 [Cyathus striatus]
MTTPSLCLSPSHTMYKGKVTRSWPQLPAELVRHIATFYLHDLALTSYTPHTWDAPELWYPRMIYASIRDAQEFEKVMKICPQWKKALETHLFWHQAINHIDPSDHYRPLLAPPPLPPNHPNQHQQPSNQLSQTRQKPLPSPYKHYTHLFTHSCLVCRINYPSTHHGLLTARKISKTHLGYIGICEIHDRKPRSFCAACLRSEREDAISCLENEDEETFPGFECTCRTCRREWLWRRAGREGCAEDVGGRALKPADWEARASVDSFIELGEGAIKDILSLCRDKLWLGKWTRLSEMMKHAEAAEVYNRPPALTSSTATIPSQTYYDEEELDEFEEDEEEDEEENAILRRTEESVKDLAVGDWARARIVDGWWITPGSALAAGGEAVWVEAIHPCHWRDSSSSSPSSSSSHSSEEEQRIKHPKMDTVKAPIPPSFELCEQAFMAYQRMMKSVLGAAMKNVVRMVVVQCALGSYGGKKRRQDPAVALARMDTEDILRILREEEGVWWEGVDWAKRWRNQRPRRTRPLREEPEEPEDVEGATSPVSATASAASSSSGSSKNGTGTSASTGGTGDSLGSPEVSSPSFEEKPEEEYYDGEVTAVPVAPVLDSPRLLWPVPYVPVSSRAWPQSTMDTFRTKEEEEEEEEDPLEIQLDDVEEVVYQPEMVEELVDDIEFPSEERVRMPMILRFLPGVEAWVGGGVGGWEDGDGGKRVRLSSSPPTVSSPVMLKREELEGLYVLASDGDED